MNKRKWFGFKSFILSVLTSLPLVASAQTFNEHMQACKSNLNFSSIPAGSCFGPNTVEVGPGSMPGTVERVGHIRVNDRVDGVLFCRDIDTRTNTADFVAMILHNRDNGNTCFIDRLWSSDGIDYPSPLHTNADDFWSFATNCVACHSTGPYLINRLAEPMAKFGLMNDGHDTHMFKYEIISANPAESAEANALLKENLVDPSCGSSCHVLSSEGFVTTMETDMLSAGVMPPGPESVFRWVNRDTPNASGDWETLKGLKEGLPWFHCDNPTRVDARAVGSDYVFSTETGFPDKLNQFNAKQGLVCKNAEQADGSCNDYKVSFLCEGQWTSWKDRDNPAGTGDYESKNSFSGICSSPEGIKAKTVVSGRTVTSYGPIDKLYRFSEQAGLACRNKDQPDRKCNNYTVKFVCP